MKTRNYIEFPRTLRDLYEHPNFRPFGSSSDDWINDTERMSRCHDAAEHGAEGSTHAEITQDWREFLERLESKAIRENRWREKVAMEIERRAEAIREEIDACEAWHEAAGSLHDATGG
jgi:hypothetical protein